MAFLRAHWWKILPGLWSIFCIYLLIVFGYDLAVERSVIDASYSPALSFTTVAVVGSLVCWLLIVIQHAAATAVHLLKWMMGRFA